ncbi:MAG: hypothetical protein ACRD00_02525, partial [Thermoanaerobaculia bacterium]
MIAFASLFLGLVIGVAPVSVLVESPVAWVRIELDGKAVGTIKRAPWRLSIDFGAELLPHELIARGFDRQGNEAASARQFVNLPRAPAEVEVVLERDAAGQPVAARFSGSSVVAFQPARATVTFDEKPLPSEIGRVKLPAYDPGERHVLSVELEFSEGLRSRTDVVLADGTSSTVRSELTAVPLRLKPSGGPLEAPALAGMLRRGGEALPVVAVENGPALVCVVRGPTVWPALEALGTGGKLKMGHIAGKSHWSQTFDRDASRHAVPLEKWDRLRFIWPIPTSVEEAPGVPLFSGSQDFTEADGGVHYLLTRVEYPHPPGLESRLADAAALAGLEAAASGSRRAVILLLGDEASDEDSLSSPAAVRRYLAAIRVPFFVWSLKSPATQPLASRWGAVEDVS